MRNSYEGLIENWTFELIQNRIRHWNVNENDTEDLMQECVMKVTDFKYEKEKSNGASLKTVYTTIIDNKIFEILRPEKIYKKHFEKFQNQFRDDYDKAIYLNEIDLTDSLIKLTDRENKVYELIMQGHSRNQIAEILGHSWATIDLSLRKAMEKLGIGGGANHAPFFNL